ncbi:MAG: hypothetical protein ABIH41_01540 [Nanoarchaeota archaeon]
MSVTAQVSIVEIMFDPQGDDAGREFVEIAGDFDERHVIGDLSRNSSFTRLSNGTNGLVLIVPEGFETAGIEASVFSAGSRIGNNLNNGGDTLFIYENGSLVHSISYDGSVGGAGYSIVREQDAWIPSCELGGSPGAQEPCRPEEESNASDDVDPPVPVDCDVDFALDAKDWIIRHGDKVEYRPIISPRPKAFSVMFSFEDVFGNAVWERTSDNDDFKVFTPTLSGGPSQPLILHGKLMVQECDPILAKAAVVLVTDIPSQGREVVFGVLRDDHDASVNVTGLGDVNFSIDLVSANQVMTADVRVLCEQGIATIGLRDAFPRFDSMRVRTAEGLVSSGPQSKGAPVISVDSHSIDGSSVAFAVRVCNDKEVDRDFSVYSYVYRGSKSYSGDRMANLLVVPLGPFGCEQVNVSNNVSASGLFLYRVVAEASDRKTPYTLRGNISINVSVERQQPLLTEPPESSQDALPSTREPLTGSQNTVYSQDKLKKYIKPLLVCTYIVGAVLWVRNGSKSDTKAH